MPLQEHACADRAHAWAQRVYDEGAASGDRTKVARFKEAAEDEYKSLTEMETWDLVPKSDLPKGRRIIGSRWVWDVKMNEDGSVNRFKARLVGKGFAQEYGLDYIFSYSNTVRYDTFRLLICAS